MPDVRSNGDRGFDPSENHTHDRVETNLAELEEARRLRVLAIVTLGMVVMAPFFVYQYISLGVPWVSVAVVVTMFVGLMNLFWSRRRMGSRVGGWIATSILLLLLVFSNLQSGGFYDPNFGWLYVFPMLAALLVDARAGWTLTVLVLLLSLAFWLAPAYGVSIPDRIPAADHAQQSLANRLSAVLAIGVLLAAISSQQRFSKRLLERSNRKLQAEIERRSQVQQQLIRTERAASMGNLSAGLAHEINNPLAYVIGNLELLDVEFESAGARVLSERFEETRHLVAESLEGALRVADLVRDLKSFSHVGEDEFGPVALAPAIEAASRLVANEMRHRARLEVDCDASLYVLGNEGRVQQVLVNLMVNAAHAIEVGSADENLVRLSARRSGDQTRLEVSDTGCGMPAEVVDQIFEPFFTTKSVGQGTGMGLFVTRNVVKSMGGSLEVESAPGVGSRFVISLRHCEAPSVSLEPCGADRESSSPARSLRILVIDDEESVLVYLQRALPHHCLTIKSNPRDALERILGGSDDDLVLCDLMMPEMTGMELYAEVQQGRPEFAKRMLFMTAGILVQEGHEFLNSLPGRWIQKPMRVANLEELIDSRIRAIEAAT